MKTHKIKLSIEFCDAVLNGEKTFEIRENDRGYQRGDKIRFIPVNKYGLPIDHKVSEQEYDITYVLSGWGVKEGYVVLSIRPIKPLTINMC